MNIYAFSSLLASYACFLLGITVYQKDRKNELNKIIVLLCIFLGYTSFVEFGNRQAANASDAFIWLKLGSFWPFVISFLLHFIILFTKRGDILQKKMYFLIYAPAVIFSVLDLTTTFISGEPRKEYWGWTYSVPENPLLYDISTAWGLFLMIFSLVLCLFYFWRAYGIERLKAKYVAFGMFIPVAVGSITDGILPLTHIKIPELGATTLIAGIIFIQYGIWKYKLFVLTPSVAAEDIVASMSNVLFLVHEDGTITHANPAALRLLGYDEGELQGQSLTCVFPEGEWEEIQKMHEYGKLKRVSNETTFITRKGQIIPVLLSVSGVQDREGNNLGTIWVGSDLTDHKKAEEVEKKDVLLKEIHHRVKNNMQIISSLLNLQSHNITDKKYEELIRESQNRIRSMALIHEKLYQSKDLENIDFKGYITDMVHDLVRSYGKTDIVLNVDIDDTFLGIDAAVPCGLIINELVANALKHAFPDGKGSVMVALHARDKMELIVQDNGVGIPESIDPKTADTLGLRLVTILVEDQLNGEIRLKRDNGTEFSITFK
ncbi:MAG: PAS domain S-box protein [Theionarchaea archaeon]|nr:PAS domain S-box protein [Theionarchaea archaeon]